MAEQEKVLVHLSDLWKEGERLAKIEALALSLESLRVVHKITLHYFFAFLGAVFFVASLFSVLLYSLIFYANGRVLPVDLFSVPVSLFGFGSLGFLVWNLRQKRWLDAFGMQDRVASLLALKR